MTTPKFLTSLNEQQRKAVVQTSGPLLILAGAGSGKTRVLTYRMASLIVQGLCLPEEILCVTFTNKAAREMESRIYKILSEQNVQIFSQLWISTFHSFCVRILKQHITLLDYKPFFTIYDSSDQLSLIKKIMKALNINDKVYPPKSIQAKIGTAKMLALTPEEINKNPQGIMDQKALDIYTRYEEELKKANALDFDDLLLKTYLLFKMYPELLSEYQKKFKYIMVDEYQDTNHIQYLLMKMLAMGHRNLAVVGDEDQSIYSWRGADISNILNFEKDFNEAQVIKLEENYRSSANIVRAASAVIKNNQQRKDKTLFTSNSEGSLIQIQEERNEYDEARFVAQKIRNLLDESYTYNDIAIFYRTNAQSRVLEEQLRTSNIPYRIVGGVRFYERMEIKDILAYLKISLNPADDLSVKRIINVPARGIGKTTVEKLEEVALQEKITLLQAIQKCVDERVFNAGTSSKIRRFAELVSQLQSQVADFNACEFYQIVLDQTDYLKALKMEGTVEAEARIQNLEELDNALTQFMKERGEEGTLQAFLEEMALVSDADDIDNEASSVTLMTLHISKGLEFPNVFIVGLEENLFPSRSFEDNSDEDIEEERRLAYVGMTRSRENLWLTYTRTRRVWGQEQMNPPSRFISEIPKNLVEFKSSVVSQGFASRYGNVTGSSAKFSSSPQYRKPSNEDFEHQSFPEDENSQEFTRGMRVKHPNFGVGSVFSTEGSGDQLKVSIVFSDNSIKKFVAKYARLEKV